MRTALVLGGSGLVGGELLKRLASDPAFTKIISFVRRKLGAANGRVEEVVVDYDKPETYRDFLAVDDVFCCLGTTIKKAGSQAAFRRIDREIPLAIARESLAAGADGYAIVTAVGSSAKSSVFYSRTKGELEDDLRALPFPEGIRIFRPSLLLGDREEERAGERVGAVVMAAMRPLLFGKLQRYRAITAGEVANAMANAAKDRKAGVTIFEGADLFAAARG